MDFATKISQHSHSMASKLSQRVGLFNCDGTYKLDAVGRFLLDVQEKHGLKFSTDKNYFNVNETQKFCETILPQLEIIGFPYSQKKFMMLLSTHEDGPYL